MKDAEARRDVAHLKSELEMVCTYHHRLQTAYNELFDFLAQEMGFEPAESLQWPYGAEVKSDPRRLKWTQPKAEIVRKKK